MFFPFLSETSTKCHTSPGQLSDTTRACQARAGHPLIIRATLCYSSLIPPPLAPHPLTIRLTSALPRPSCILQCFCQTLHAKQRYLASAAKLPPAVCDGGEQGTREQKSALREMARCHPVRFSAKKKQPNTEVSFLPHSLTQKKASQLSAFMCQGD